MTKFFPTMMRCEKTHFWGYAMSPEGDILTIGSPDSIASWSLDYQKGVFAQTIIKCTDNSKSVTVEILGSTGQYHLNDRNYTLRIHLDKKPISVISGDSLLSNWTFDETNSTLEVTIAKKADEKISVMLNK
jgi:hypothetical protein